MNSSDQRRRRNRRTLLGTAAVVLGLGAGMALATPADATVRPNSLPVCHSGTDGGRRGMLDCSGGAGHVELITHCSWSAWAYSGWLWDNGGNFHYENTCTFHADDTENHVKP
ncbi:hypothetical protein [Actinoallomurus sp. NPDC050550]|uniref:hypothetical protein n=1 Tax=Actinoallomurus sp. NPDC050550 TaxID=3154937 RepID=UPI0033D7CBA8